MSVLLDFFTGQLTVSSSSGSSTTIGGTIVGSTNYSLLSVNGSGQLAQLGPLTNGQLLIGSTGGTAVPASLTGTSNQVIVTPGSGSITLSLPQNINTTSSPTFNALTITNNISASTYNSYIPENTANKGVANGYVPLDGSNKISVAFLPSAVMEYQGVWNPSTNTPTLNDTTGSPINGYVYRVNTDFTGSIVGLTDPSMTVFHIGDFVVYSGPLVKWQRSPAADGVTSVNSLTGAVTVNAINQLTGDITSGPVSGSASAASTVAKIQGTTVSGTTGTTNVVFSNSPTLVAPNLGTPSSLIGTNITGTAPGFTSGNVTTNANLTGDVTSIGNSTTLVTVNSNVGTFGSSTSIPSFTVNAKGLITAASGNVVIAPAGTLTGTTLASNVVFSSLTSVGTITTGTWNGSAIAAINGGTGFTTYTTGDTIYASATNTLSKLPIGTSNQLLTVVGGIPSWTSPAVVNGFAYLATNTSVYGGTNNTLSFTGSDNTAVGVHAGLSLTTGGDNTFYGFHAGQSVSTAFNNTFIGSAAGVVMSTLAHDNTFLGYQAGNSASTANFLTAIGSQTGSIGTITGANDTLVGAGAGQNLSSGHDNTLLGWNVGLNIATANFLTAVGSSSAGSGIMTGANNSLFGYQTGNALTSGHDNTFIGYQAGLTDTTRINATALGSGALNTADNQMMFGNTSITTNVFHGSIAAGSITTSTFVAPTIQKFISGTSQTYTLPTSPRSPLYIVVEMAGGGGGGGGSGVGATPASGTNGNASSFGTLIAGGGSGGNAGSGGNSGGSGGTNTFSGSGLSYPGQRGTDGQYIALNVFFPGGNGGNTSFFCGGGAGIVNGNGGDGTVNSGGGGSGGGTGTTGVYNGGGGGSGGFIRAVIGSPSSTYTYTVGASATGGASGTSGNIGGAGAAGLIIVTEYYQ